MRAVFEKTGQQQNAKSSLASMAVENLMGTKSSVVSNIALPEKKISVSGENKPNNNEIREEVHEMVTSTIIETQSAGSAAMAVANDMARDDRPVRSAIKDATAAKKSESSSKRRGRDLSSGMELLEMDFVLDVVENTAGSEKTEITMRQLCFKELLRRESMTEIGSAALKVYTTNGPTYGKDIQCEAMKELALRTSQNSK